MIDEHLLLGGEERVERYLTRIVRIHGYHQGPLANHDANGNKHVVKQKINYHNNGSARAL